MSAEELLKVAQEANIDDLEKYGADAPALLDIMIELWR